MLVALEDGEMADTQPYCTITAQGNIDTVDTCVRVSDTIMEKVCQGNKFLVLNLQNSRIVSSGFTRFMNT